MDDLGGFNPPCNFMSSWEALLNTVSGTVVAIVIDQHWTNLTCACILSGIIMSYTVHIQVAVYQYFLEPHLLFCFCLQRYPKVVSTTKYVSHPAFCRWLELKFLWQTHLLAMLHPHVTLRLHGTPVSLDQAALGHELPLHQEGSVHNTWWCSHLALDGKYLSSRDAQVLWQQATCLELMGLS